MGKKRSSHPPIPDLIKIEVKDEIADSSVLMARDRFKGALRELLRNSDEGSSDSGDDIPIHDHRPSPKKIDPPYKAKINSVKKAVKRRRPINMDSAFHHTYVMKLFDRSVDLAQFEEETPLYPICRAWMANQPRNPNLVPKVRSPSPEVPNESGDLTDIFDADGGIKDINRLPPPLPSEEAFPHNRVPSPVPHEVEDKLDLDYENNSLKSKEELMKEHREHWNSTRKKWHDRAHKNEQRYRESAKILTTIFQRAQSEYE